MIREVLEDIDVQYDVVRLGGSIGDATVSRVGHLKGEPVPKDRELFSNIEDAKKKAKQMNSLVSPGEKKFYKIKYL